MLSSIAYHFICLLDNELLSSIAYHIIYLLDNGVLSSIAYHIICLLDNEILRDHLNWIKSFNDRFLKGVANA